MSSLTIVEGPRTFTITPDDHGGIILVVGCVLMTWTLLCFMIRLYNRFSLRSSLGLDDLACGLATAIGVAQTIVMCAAVSNGFGKSSFLVAESHTRRAEKCMYAVAILSVGAIAITKAAMLFFHLRITPHRSQRITCYALVALCTVWAVVVMTLVGTRCGNHTPETLYAKYCENYENRWIGVAVTDSCLEVIIFAIPVWILWAVNTRRSYKAAILVAFGSRLLIPVAAAFQVYTSVQWATTEPPFAPVQAVLPFVWLSVETNYAIMAATIPTLGNFFKSINTRWGAMDGPDVVQYALESLSEQSRSDNRTATGSKNTATEATEPSLRPDGSTYSFRMRSPRPSNRRELSSAQTGASDESNLMIIRKTVSTSVERAYQDQDDGRRRTEGM